MPTVTIVNSMTINPGVPARPYTYPHVEDYIEIIAGYRLPDGKSRYNIFEPAQPVISLARYDMKIIPSLAEQTIGQNKGFTDKQARLAADLVIKYERQLARLGVDVSPVHTPAYRFPIRQIDRSTRAWVENNTLKLKFPYDVALIEQVRSAIRDSKGSFEYNRVERVHHADLTEWNLNWIYSFAVQHNFEIDHTVKQLMDLVMLAEQTPYQIELHYAHDQLAISHAADSMIDHVETHLGGFALDNILTLCDHAPVLGYSVHSDIQHDVIKNFGTRFWSLCSNRNLKVGTIDNSDLVQCIIDFAELTARWPIFVYEPDLSGRLYAEFHKFFPGAIVNLDNKLMDKVIDDSVRLVYTTRIPKQHFPRIPLMISGAGMLYGGDRQMWLQSAEKVVYFTKDVYNKNIKGKDVCKLD